MQKRQQGELVGQRKDLGVVRVVVVVVVEELGSQHDTVSDG
jgi:hypothetical protein